MISPVRVIAPEQHIAAIRDLIADPQNDDSAKRIVDYALREPDAAHAAHMLVAPLDAEVAPTDIPPPLDPPPTPAGVYQPRSLDELAALVQEAAKKKLTIKAIGAGNALSNIDETAGYLLSLGAYLNRVIRTVSSSLRPAARAEILYTVEAGATIDTVNRVLWANDNALHNQPGFEGLTLVGTASVGGHGSGHKLGGIAESIRAVRLLCFDGNGNVQRLQIEPKDGISDPAAFDPTKEDGFVLKQDNDLFYSVVVGLGGLGVIHSVVVSARDAYFLQETRELMEWDSVAQRLPALLTDNDIHSFAVWLNPYRKGVKGTATCLLSKYTPTTDKPRGIRGLGILFGGSNLVSNIIVWWVKHCPDALPGLMDNALKSAADSDVVMPCTEALNFGAPNHLHVTASACGIDWSNTSGAVQYIEGFANEIAKKKQYITSPVGLRFVAPSRAYMSPQFGRSTCMIEMPMLAGTPGATDSLDEFQDEMFAQFKARPHWGQRLRIDKERVASMYGDNVAKYRAALEALGCVGRFSNALLKNGGLDA